MSYQPDDDTLLFRMGEAPRLPVQLEVVATTQIVAGVPRPDLNVTAIAAQWAAALELSKGGGALVQLATGYDDRAEPWGPCELITPQVDDDLDSEITDDGTGGLLLGRDFMSAIVLTFIGPAGLMVVMRSSQTDAG